MLQTNCKAQSITNAQVWLSTFSLPRAAYLLRGAGNWCSGAETPRIFPSYRAEDTILTSRKLRRPGWPTILRTMTRRVSMVGLPNGARSLRLLDAGKTNFNM